MLKGLKKRKHNIVMITICNSITEISPSFVNKKYFYISVGSKHNEDLMYMKNYYGCIKRSNATEQMIPYFYREKKEALFICVDRFSPQELKKNKKKIKEIEIEEIVLYNSDATIQSIKEFIIYMTEHLQKNGISAENVFIANFVRFVSPNHTENYFEEEIPNVIYKYLSTEYKKRFYQWYGYQSYTYNLLYNYENYRFMIGYTNILSLLKGVYDDETLSYTNLYMIEEKANIRTIYLNMFLKNTVDMTSPLEISLYDYYAICDSQRLKNVFI